MSNRERMLQQVRENLRPETQEELEGHLRHIARNLFWHLLQFLRNLSERGKQGKGDRRRGGGQGQSKANGDTRAVFTII